MKRGRGEETAEGDDDGEVHMHLLQPQERERNCPEAQGFWLEENLGDHGLRNGGPERGRDPERQQVPQPETHSHPGLSSQALSCPTRSYGLALSSSSNWT